MDIWAGKKSRNLQQVDIALERTIYNRKTNWWCYLPSKEVSPSAIKNLPRWQTNVVPGKEHTVMGSTIYEESVEQVSRHIKDIGQQPIHKEDASKIRDISENDLELAWSTSSQIMGVLVTDGELAKQFYME